MCGECLRSNCRPLPRRQAETVCHLDGLRRGRVKVSTRYGAEQLPPFCACLNSCRVKILFITEQFSLPLDTEGKCAHVQSAESSHVRA